MTPRVALEEASVRLGPILALEGVDLTVGAGQVVVVLGPSGSGKSTLLRAVAGLEPLAAGRILIDGTDQVAVPPHRRGVGLMFQDHVLFPHLDVGANVAFGLRMQGRGRDEIRAAVADHLALVGLPGAAERAVHTLSGGEQQRVALARALAPAPRVLLLDEPFGSLDRPRREQLLSELGDLFDRLGTTVLAVTHDHAEAFALGDRLALLDAGQLLQAGPVDAVWERPTSRRAAELLGFANVVEATVEDGRLRTPWGLIGVSQPGAMAALVRPDGVRVGEAGPLAATVASVAFAGGRRRLRLQVVGAPDLEAEVASTARVRAGDRVQVAIEPSAVVALLS